MSASAKISSAQRIAALKAIGNYSPLHRALGTRLPGLLYGLDDEYQYAWHPTGVFRWHVCDNASPVNCLDLSPLGDLALSSAQSFFVKYDNESDKDFPMAVGEFKRTYAAGPLKECSSSEAFSLDNKRFNPRLLSRVLYVICSRENCVPVFRSYGNAVQPIYLCGDLGEAVLCPLRPIERY